MYGFDRFDLKLSEVAARPKNKASRAYQLAYLGMLTNQKTLVSVLTSLVTSIGNQSRKCLIPWKHLGNLWLETEVF